MQVDFVWAGSQEVTFVIKPVPVNQAKLAKIVWADQVGIGG